MVKCGPWGFPAGLSVNSGNEQTPGTEPHAGVWPQRGRCKTTTNQSQNNHTPVLGQGKGCIKVEALHLLLLVPGDGLSATESEIGPGPRPSVHLPSPEHQACLLDLLTTSS